MSGEIKTVFRQVTFNIPKEYYDLLETIGNYSTRKQSISDMCQRIVMNEVTKIMKEYAAEKEKLSCIKCKWLKTEVCEQCKGKDKYEVKI